MTAGIGRIERVVIIVKENHGFDNYFGTFPGADGATLPHATNPPAADPDHRHGAWLTRTTTAVGEQFTEADIRSYFAYARQFTLCDRYFTDVAGPSTPNHLMLIAGDSPIIDNPPAYRLPKGTAPFDVPTFPGALAKAGHTWGNYGGYAFAMLQELASVVELPSAQFATDAAKGNLPTVSWVYAPHDASEHPPDPSDKANPLVGNVTHGMQWTVAQIDAIVAGGLWPTTAIFVTWDDWGGWGDHVTPPLVETWTGSDPRHPNYAGTQFRYGTRVACLVLSPFARAGYVSHVQHSHVSLLKCCATLFAAAPPHPRVAAADDMGDCFDFSQAPLGPPHA
ncbi:MAG TPA: alkaline phosphatase family protein [Gemmatirosa sp.]